MSTNDLSAECNYATTGTCTTCGFVPQSVSALDALEALGALPVRWRNALALRLDDPEPEAALRGRLRATGWSALEHAGHVRDVVHALDIRLERVLREDQPTLPETHVTPPAGANEQGVAVILAALAVSTDQLSGTIEATPAAAWSRSGLRRGVAVTALDLVREAVHEGSHHLDLATSTLEALRTSATAVGR